MKSGSRIVNSLLSNCIIEPLKPNFKKDYSEGVGEDVLLIPGLPNDLAKKCLALAPRLDFPAMGSVSKAWKALLQSQEFHLLRKSAGTLEEWLYALIVDDANPEKSCWQVLSPDCSQWKPLPPMPGRSKAAFGYVVVDGKLLVMGGACEEASGIKAVADVHKYDSALNRWSIVSSMQNARYSFACTVLRGFVYVVGGHGEDGKNLSTVEVYDVQKDEWTHAPSLRRARWGCIACGIEGKMYVMGGRSSYMIGNNRCIAIYDSSTRQWDEVKNGCVVVLSHAVLKNKLYCIEWKNERKLAVFNPDDTSWKHIPVPFTGGLNVGFCLGSFNGKLVLFPKKPDPKCKTLVYNPNGAKGAEWQTSGVRPLGSCLFCAAITA